MKFIRRTAKVAAVAGSLALVLSGCSTIGSDTGGGDREAGGKALDEVVIGFAQRQVDAPYFAAMVQIAEDRAKAEGWEVRVQNADGDAVTQIDQAQTLVSQGVDVLVVDSMSPASQKVQFADIAQEVPLVFVDTGIDEVGITTVQSDNYEIGKLSGGLTAERIGAGSEITVAVLNGGPDDEVVGPQRQQGFLDGLEAGGVGYEVVAEQPAVYSQDRAVPATENILSAHPDVDLILGLNDSMALGALTVLEDQGNTTTLVAASADGQKEAIKKMMDEGCDAQYVSTGLNSPELAADEAFTIALQIATGEAAASDFEPVIHTEAVGIDCDNAAEYYNADSLF
ncbi:substrate-binding domain-containing protein [Leucobacter allii]|uniref:Substrate-binding domain-containing protein n=1 Tax=Leucobacter allii TaxID=2932247 RepID=A0ABY4FNK6_9MICO|nr:substrate-binding domain-containing protein [Leucobacter allii]UOQ57866.1 substrate-binding domain-containing protein [Leucobacter allii]UOR02507.1 substrate-binding domain-containing protein [Leucobacter allii]